VGPSKKGKDELGKKKNTLYRHLSLRKASNGTSSETTLGGRMYLLGNYLTLGKVLKGLTLFRKKGTEGVI